MLKSILRVKNCGIFYNYQPSLPYIEFKKFNLIYGWNGTGKTTLTRLFNSLTEGSSKNFPNLEYKIETSQDTLLRQGQPFTESKIMVFNQDYVSENAPSLADPKAKTKHIYVLGKDDKEKARQIAADRKELLSLTNELNKQDKKSVTYRRKQLDDSRNALFKGTADTIASIKGGAAIRSYNRTNAISVYKSLNTKEELAKEELEKNHKLIDQQVLNNLKPINLPQVEVNNSGQVEKYKLTDFLIKTTAAIRTTLESTIQQVLIHRLKENTDIADWVADGIEIHSHHKSPKCEYCGQEIPAVRLDELAKHFNDAYDQVVRKIYLQINTVTTIKNSLNSLDLVDKANFYPHFQEEYEAAKSLFIKDRKSIITTIEESISQLNDKTIKTHEPILYDGQVKLDDLQDHLSQMNEVINKHNRLTATFQATVEEAKTKLEKHYVSVIYDQVKLLDEDIASLDLEITTKTSRVKELEEQISQSESAIRNSKQACADINDCLHGILGRDEIIFEDDEEGYVIKRNGDIAENLSEGEKTAIAFAYFLIHLTGKDFDLAKGVIIIDDPISSLDIDGIYRICSLFDTRLKKAEQLIILTHNFDLFNHVKKWFINDPEINNRDDSRGQFLMIKNSFAPVKKQREAYIDALDPLLQDYESEYHYLFKKLYNFKTDVVATAQGTIEAVYQYPNLARKVMECFLSFRVPIRGSMYTRMLGMGKINTSITTTDIKEVYNFINSNSHLDTKTGLIQFDPTLGPNGQRYIEKTLQLIEACDNSHFEAMVRAINREAT